MSSDKVLVEAIGNTAADATLQAIRQINEEDIEQAKQEWIQSENRFKYLLEATPIPGLQIQVQNQSFLSDSFKIFDAEDPRFYYDTRINRYRYAPSDIAAGRLVSQEAIENITKRRIALAETEIKSYEQALISRRIDIGTFQTAVARSLRTLYLQSYALGRGGFRQINSLELNEVSLLLDREYEKLRRIGEAITRRELSNRQLDLVIRNTITDSQIAFNSAKREASRQAGSTHVRRFLGQTINDRHCADCLYYASLGTVPIYTIPLPKQQCACGSQCKCSIQFYTAEGIGLEDG